MRSDRFPTMFIRGRMAKPVLKIDGYKITCDWYSIDRLTYREITPEMVAWLDESIVGYWYALGHLIYFSNEEDFTLFALTWV